MATQFSEGQRLQGSDGNVYVVRGGVPTLESAPAPSGSILSLPPDEQQAAAIAASRASTAHTTQEMQRSTATLPFDTQKAAADAKKAQADAEKAQRDLAAQQSTATPEQQKRMAALGNDEVLKAIDDARNGVNGGHAAGYWARLGQLPGVGGLIEPQSVVDLRGSLNTIASRLALDKLAQLKQASPTGASGMGSLTEKEGELLRDSVAALGQTQSPDKLLDHLADVEKHYRNFMALSNGEDYRDPKVAEKYGIARAPDEQKTASLAQGENREEPDPALAGVNGHIRGMIGAGKSANDIIAYMNAVRPGLGNDRAADVLAATKFRAQNPSVPLDRYAVSVENRSVPMSGTRQLFNTAAQTPGGAYAVAAGDALTAGTLDNMQDNPAQARAAMSALADQDPVSTFAGTLSGGALASALSEGAVARAGATWAPRLGDALYGAAYGAGTTDEGNRLTGALKGATIGTAGGMAGRQAGRALGSALTGVTDPSVQYLRQADVPMTFGTMVANSGPRGARLKAREDRLGGFGGVGDSINNLRRGSLEGFNRAAYNEALAPIGGQAMNQVGEGAVEQADNVVGAAYDRALNPVRLQRDRQFGLDMQGPTVAANRLPGEMGTNARYTLNERVGTAFDPNGTLTGNNFQQSVRGLEQDARAVRSQPYGNDFRQVARGARTALEGLLERQSPGSLDAYLAANAANRNTSVLAEATGNAMNTDGVFTPAQLGTAARSNARQFTGRMSAATTDRPFFELQRAGQQVLPSKVPDSGTAGRMEQNGGVTAMIRGAVRNALNAPLYSPGTQDVLATLLLDRPDAAVQFGQRVLGQARRGGIFGAPIALNYGPTAVVPGY